MKIPNYLKLTKKVLFNVAQPATFENPHLNNCLIDKMYKFMVSQNAIGLAAPQIGISKRIFDILSSTCAIFILAPFFVFIAILIRIDSKGPIIYRQKRVGKGNKDFYLNKFRTMVTDADKKGQLTVGMRDSRITKMGYFLRKYKLDEFPQLINVLNGEMSIVGPRPEVRKYVNLYNENKKWS